MSDFMKWPKRILLFVGTNILIVLTLSILARVTGLDAYLYRSGMNYASLAVFCLFWGMGGAFISLGLSRIIAKMSMGVKVINPETENHPALRALVGRVHDLARKAGLTTMPEVGYYESPELNAFATGPTRNRSLVAVSTGLLNRMSDDEVDGVLAHEIAHIANGDMVTMTLIQGVMNAFVMFLARILAFAITNALAGNRNSEDNRGSSPFMQYMIVFVLEMVLSVFATMVVMAFSRWREYRADAGGASLAGRPKMVAALQALKRNYQLPPSAEPEAASVATLKISSRRAGGLARLFLSHPPLDERIEALQKAQLSAEPSYARF